jgi:hypothetical protein
LILNIIKNACSSLRALISRWLLCDRHEGHKKLPEKDWAISNKTGMEMGNIILKNCEDKRLVELAQNNTEWLVSAPQNSASS